MTTVLIIEREAVLVDLWKRIFWGRLNLIATKTIVEAKQIFRTHPEIGAIVVDGLIFTNNVSSHADALTIDIIIEFRGTFKGPMIASSAFECVRRLQMEYGCDHQCLKEDVAVKLSKLLKL